MQPLQLARSILRRWLKAMAVMRCSTAGIGGKRGLGQGGQMHHAECTLGAG
jgi:hypothetical protein